MRCPHCGSSRIHRDGYTEKGAAKYHCLNCHEYLNELTNSVSAFVREVQEIGEKIEGEIRFFVKRKLSRDDTKKTLKTVAEGEIRVNTDEYSIYECVIEGKT